MLGETRRVDGVKKGSFNLFVFEMDVFVEEWANNVKKVATEPSQFKKGARSGEGLEKLIIVEDEVEDVTVVP